MAVAIAYSPHCIRHVTPEGHPERPERVQVIYQALKPLQLKEIAVRAATFEEVALVHSDDYIALVQNEVQALQPGSFAWLSTGDVTICSESYDVALTSAGCSISAVDAIMKGDIKRCFVIARPPGHHAMSGCGMGFCLFNNAAIACRYMQIKYKVKRVAIVDWDVHHGNGTQEIFYSDASVFYFSTHQFGIYPGTGHRLEIGVGNIMNCPILPGALSAVEVRRAFSSKLIPAMDAFKPECIIISAGFDAHRDDPLGGMNLVESDYEALTRTLVDISEKYADGRILSVLEGGYNLQALSTASLAHVKSLI